MNEPKLYYRVYVSVGYLALQPTGSKIFQRLKQL